MPTGKTAENIRTLRNGARVTLLRLDGTPPPEKFLSAAELAKCSSFRIEKRRADWLGGRYAAKTLLRELLGLSLPLQEIEISSDPFGRPVWRGGSGVHLISITHSGPYCAAAAKAGPSVFLGLDLEKAEPRAGPWYEDYFHRSELEAPENEGTVPILRLACGSPVNRDSPRSLKIHGSPVNGDSPRPLDELATKLWTEKEALLKALGLGLSAHPLDIKIGKDIQFSNAALKRYEELGRPEYLIETSRLDSGYYLSTAVDN